MSAERPATTDLHAPPGQLERALIEQFVRARGYDPHKLDELPEHERETLLKDASLDASVKLSEIESRSHFVDELHDSTPGVHRAGHE